MDGQLIGQEFHAQTFGRTIAPMVGCQGIDAGHRYRVRRQWIEPGGRLAPCSHLHRAEQWVVVQGTARVTRAGNTQLFTEGQAFHVPLGQVHALENPGHIPLILIEVWIGLYLEEDDVIPDQDPLPQL